MNDDLTVEVVAASLTALALAKAFERMPNPDRTPHPLDDERGLNAWEAKCIDNVEKGSQVLVDLCERVPKGSFDRFQPWFGGRQILPESYTKFGMRARTAHEQAIKAASTVVHLKGQPLESNRSWFKVSPLKDWDFTELSEEVRAELVGWLRENYSPQEAQDLIDRAQAHAGLPFAAHRVQFTVRPPDDSSPRL